VPSIRPKAPAWASAGSSPAAEHRGRVERGEHLDSQFSRRRESGDNTSHRNRDFQGRPAFARRDGCGCVQADADRQHAKHPGQRRRGLAGLLDLSSNHRRQRGFHPGQATGVGNGAVNAISGIVNVRGGAGNDTLIGNGGNILVGGSGNDTLTDAYAGSSTTASARSLLIGGAGGDTLTAGNAGDILISGTTTFDINNAALQSILAEWQSADSYTLRFQRLQGVKSAGTGLNGKNDLIWGKTVKDDLTADTLTGGGSAAGLDWFFASYPGGTDTINNFDAPGDEYLNNAL